MLDPLFDLRFHQRGISANVGQSPIFDFPSCLFTTTLTWWQKTKLCPTSQLRITRLFKHITLKAVGFELKKTSQILLPISRICLGVPWLSLSDGKPFPSACPHSQAHWSAPRSLACNISNEKPNTSIALCAGGQAVELLCETFCHMLDILHQWLLFAEQCVDGVSFVDVWQVPLVIERSCHNTHKLPPVSHAGASLHQRVESNPFQENVTLVISLFFHFLIRLQTHQMCPFHIFHHLPQVSCNLMKIVPCLPVVQLHKLVRDLIVAKLSLCPFDTFDG